MKTFDEVPVEKEKVMHEVREVTASFPSRFTDQQQHKHSFELLESV